jgi:hypothetical protein
MMMNDTKPEDYVSGTSSSADGEWEGKYPWGYRCVPQSLPRSPRSPRWARITRADPRRTEREGPSTDGASTSTPPSDAKSGSFADSPCDSTRRSAIRHSTSNSLSRLNNRLRRFLLHDLPAVFCQSRYNTMADLETHIQPDEVCFASVQIYDLFLSCGSWLTNSIAVG